MSHEVARLQGGEAPSASQAGAAAGAAPGAAPPPAADPAVQRELTVSSGRDGSMLYSFCARPTGEAKQPTAYELARARLMPLLSDETAAALERRLAAEPQPQAGDGALTAGMRAAALRVASVARRAAPAGGAPPRRPAAAARKRAVAAAAQSKRRAAAEQPSGVGPIVHASLPGTSC